MNILVTGGSGFVGAAVVRRLLNTDAKLRVLVREDSDRRNLNGLPVTLCIGDLRDKKTLDAALAGCDGLFHVAADYRLWARRPQELYDINVTGTFNICRAAVAAGVTRIVYTSSVAVLGLRSDGQPSDEDTPVTATAMIGHYKHSKYQAEQRLRQCIEHHGWPVVIVNPSTPIGPRDIKPTPTGRVILDAARGRLPAYVDTGLNIVHVDDVAEGHWLAFMHGRIGRRYILGGEDVALGQLLAMVAQHCGRSPPRLRLPHAAVYPIALLAETWARLFNGNPLATVDEVRMARKKMYFSSRRAKDELGYCWRSPQAAIADAVQWFSDNGYV